MRIASTARSTCALCATLIAGSASAQQVPRPIGDDVEAVLQALEVDHLLSTLDYNAGKMLGDVGPSLDDATRARVRAALSTGFSLDRLHQEVADYVRIEGGRAQLDAFRRWLLSDAVRAIRAKLNPDVMPESFQGYAQYLAAHPAPKGRFDLVARLVYAQQGGELFVLTNDRLRSSLERLVEQAGGPGAPRRDTRSLDPEPDRLEKVNVTTFVSLLSRLEPLSDAEAETLVAGYESDAGQWWAQTYSAAVLAAIDAATDSASAALR